MSRVLLTSLTRIIGLQPDGQGETLSLDGRYAVVPVDRKQWQTGDYVVGRVIEGSPLRLPMELPSGRMGRWARATSCSAPSGTARPPWRWWEAGRMWGRTA